MSFSSWPRGTPKEPQYKTGPSRLARVSTTSAILKDDDACECNRCNCCTALALLVSRACAQAAACCKGRSTSQTCMYARTRCFMANRCNCQQQSCKGQH